MYSRCVPYGSSSLTLVGLIYTSTVKYEYEYEPPRPNLVLVLVLVQ